MFHFLVHPHNKVRMRMCRPAAVKVTGRLCDKNGCGGFYRFVRLQIFFCFSFFDFKIGPKSQNMNLQKRHLEVSRYMRD